MSKQITELPKVERRVCDCCGAHAVWMSYATEHFNYKTEQDKVVELSVQVPVWTCRACGERYTDHRGEEIRHARVCEFLGRLTPAEIRELREGIGYTQSQWADLTGFGVASVKRWESGALIQGLAQDRYMRLLREERNIAALQIMAGISERPAGQKAAFRTELPAVAVAHAAVFQLRVVTPVAAAA
jgi:putative zinc finger/helix-turn-helix YgiT family protein